MALVHTTILGAFWSTHMGDWWSWQIYMGQNQFVFWTLFEYVRIVRGGSYPICTGRVMIYHDVHNLLDIKENERSSDLSRIPLF